MKVSHETYVDFKLRSVGNGRIDHGKISLAKPRSTTRPIGFTADNIKNGAARIASFYKRVGNKVYGGKIPRKKVMEVYTKRVCEHLRLEVEDVMKHSKKREYVLARQIVYYLAKKEGLTLKDCGDYYNQDHTTVMWAVETITNRVDTDSEFRSMMHEIENKVR